MNEWELPEALEVNGKILPIRTKYSAILDIIAAINDPELPDYAKNQVMMEILYIDEIAAEDMETARKKALWFIDCGMVDDGKPKPRTMDWKQDANILFPSINKVLGYETRMPQKYTHWWTFIGAFYEIQDGLFSQVLAIRQKKASGKKLEKWEKDFYNDNHSLILLKAPMSEAEKELRQKEQEAVDTLFM